jgi:hypothetical protein
MKWACTAGASLLHAIIFIATLAEAGDLLQILTQPGLAYARQVMVVQPVIKANPSVQSVEVRTVNGTLGLFGKNIMQTKSGFANFTDLGFQNPGVYVLVFNADGTQGIRSSPIFVQVWE